jgi:hypothetical protein
MPKTPKSDKGTLQNKIPAGKKDKTQPIFTVTFLQTPSRHI